MVCRVKHRYTHTLQRHSNPPPALVRPEGDSARLARTRLNMNNQDTIAQHKKNLRFELKQRRQSVTPAQRDRAAKQIAKSALTLASNSKRIGLYYALPNEAPTQPLAHALWKIGRQVYLPRIHNDRHLHFSLWEQDTALESGKLGIPSPTSTNTEIGAGDLDLIFIPLLGFDQSGHRLGMGGGYYDTTLSRIAQPTKIGVAFDCQEVEHIPVEEHDIRLDLLITESRVLRFQ